MASLVEMFDDLGITHSTGTQEVDGDALVDFVLALDEDVNDSEWTLELIDTLRSSIESSKYKIWCDGVSLRLTWDGRPPPGDEFGLCHEFEEPDHELARRLFDTFEAGWAIKFGCAPKLWPGPDEPDDRSGIHDDGSVTDAHGNVIGGQG